MSVTRRTLKFNDLDAAVRDAELLLAGGYEKAGNWDLAQVCNHLTEWIRYPMDGYPRMPVVARPIVWLMKVTFGKRMGRKMFLEDGSMRTGMQTIPQTVFPGGQDDREAVERFKEIVGRWKANTNPPHPSPLLGTFTREEWDRGQCVHTAHHLSFLVPKNN